MSKFTEAFEAGTKGLTAISTGFLANCEECRDELDICCEHKAKAMVENNEIHDEPYYSWSPCDFCNSHFGGDRYTAHALNEDNEILHFSVCTDCVFFINNGDEPETLEG